VILTAAAIVAQAAPSAAPSAAATSAADAAVAGRAKDWLHMIQAGKIDRSQLDAKMNAVLTDTTLAQVSAQLAPLGDPTSFTFVNKSAQGSFTVYVYKVVFPAITLYESFALDSDGKIGGLYLKPQQ
jgi:hypothetical protein